VREAAGTGGVVHGAVRAQLDRAHAQLIVAITDSGHQGLIALQASQAYVREVAGSRSQTGWGRPSRSLKI